MATWSRVLDHSQDSVPDSLGQLGPSSHDDGVGRTYRSLGDKALVRHLHGKALMLSIERICRVEGDASCADCSQHTH
jgi:hypothetical protein